MTTLLVERDDNPRGASWGNAGHIATEQVEPLAALATLRSFPRRLFWRGGALALPPGAWRHWLPFAIALVAAARPRRFDAGKQALRSLLRCALPAWRRLLEHADTPSLLREDGHFIVWESEASAAQSKRRWAGADIGETTMRDMTGDELAQVGRLLDTPLAGGVRFAGSGHITDTGLLAATLLRHLVESGGRVETAAVTALERQGGGVTARLADGRNIAARIAVVAGGAASAGLLRPHGVRVPMIAERGYHIESRVDGADWPEDMPPVVFEDRSMIVTRFQTALRAASFVEFASSAHPADPRKWARLHKHAAALGLPIGDDARRWMGARPTLPDYLPAIGQCPTAPELFYAFGHQHLGLTLAACTAEALGALVAGEPPCPDLAPFSLSRFD